MSEKYRPSNSVAGEIFMEKYCNRCRREPINPNARGHCKILTLTMAFDKSDPQYPSQWTYQGGSAVCTAFRDRDEKLPARRKLDLTERQGVPELFEAGK